MLLTIRLASHPLSYIFIKVRLSAPFVAAPLAVEAVALCSVAWCGTLRRETAALKSARYADAAAGASEATLLSPTSADAALALALHAAASSAAAPQSAPSLRRSEVARSPSQPLLNNVHVSLFLFTVLSTSCDSC